MDIRNRKEEEQIASSSVRRRYAIGIASLSFIVLCAVFAVRCQNPPGAQSAAAPGGEFASGRAMKHIKEIAVRPHPVGSAEHSTARDYILKELAGLGVNPETQRSLVVTQQRGGSYGSAVVQNLIGRLAGVDGKQAVLLTCHYDSAPTSPGASDDGSGVAALLEVLRALKSGPPLKNDLLFLFTDAEEIGMLGARAFMDEHPSAREVAVVMNFEARGIGGPAIMFETSEGNGWLIKELAESVPHPVANSLTYDLYKLLPNATDLTIFKNGGLRGLNFAYIKGVSSYHTVRDSYDNLDERSLQHHGSYALALARRFGNQTDWPEPGGNAVYFDLFSFVLVFYSGRLVLPLMMLGLVFFAGVVILGFRMGRLTIRGVSFGILVFPSNVIAVGAVMMIAWLTIQNVVSNPMGGRYNGGLYATGFLLLTIGITAATLHLVSRKTRLENLIVGALFWWAVLTVWICLVVPGGSYLLTWPLILMALALGMVFIVRAEIASTKSLAVLTAPALSGVILIAPLISLMIMGFGLGVIGLLMALVVLLLALHYAHLNLLIESRPWMLPAISGVLGICLIGAALLMADVSAGHPKKNHIVYVLNTDTHKALWASADENPDEWTSQFFSSGAVKANLAEYFPWGSGAFLKGEAPVLPLSPPEIEVLNDQTEGGRRALLLRIRSPRKAPAMAVYWRRELEVAELAVNGKRATKPLSAVTGASDEYRRFYYVGLPEEGIELKMELKTSAPLELKLEDWSYGLPQIPSRPFTARPDYLIAAPYPYSDCSVVMRSITF